MGVAAAFLGLRGFSFVLFCFQVSSFVVNVYLASGEGGDENWHNLTEFLLHLLHLYFLQV